MCLGPWEPHGSSWYACNRFDDTQAKNARDAQEVRVRTVHTFTRAQQLQRSRAALARYLHYCNRYMNHMRSSKLEHKVGSFSFHFHFDGQMDTFITAVLQSENKDGTNATNEHELD
jgi:hypothetical protein